MKTPEEWLEIYRNNTTNKLSTEFFIAVVKDIQSDAFHDGTLAGIKEAQEIVRCHANQFNVDVVKAIDSMGSK